MKNSSFLRTTKVQRLVIFLLIALVIGGLPLLACAFSRTRPTASLTITNNSNLEFRHAYFAPADGNNWGPDQLNGSSIGPGTSRSLSPSCDGGNIKAILEDQNGCFVYQTVSCSDNATWTVTNDATPDCGGGGN
jgi:hypothetical protein